MSNDLSAACQRLRAVPHERLESWRARGRKADFFHALQAETQPFSLTKAAHNEPSPHERIRAASEGHRVRVHAVGDSISRELAQALKALVSDAPTVNATFAGINVPTSLQAGAARWERQWTPHALDALEGCQLDVLFLGGYGPWAIRRFERYAVGPTVVKSPLAHHEAFITNELKIMQCVARRTQRVEVAPLMSSP